jgi:hypothetical protein
LQRGQLDLLKRQDAERKADRKRDQARLISAWITSVDGGIATDASTHSEVYLANISVDVTNGSDEPVWNRCVRVKSTWGSDYKLEWRRLAVLPPRNTQTVGFRMDLPPSYPS